MKYIKKIFILIMIFTISSISFSTAFGSDFQSEFSEDNKIALDNNSIEQYKDKLNKVVKMYVGLEGYEDFILAGIVEDDKVELSVTKMKAATREKLLSKFGEKLTIIEDSTLVKPRLETFKDVNKDDWYFEAVETMNIMGIVQGFNGLFDPNNKITREESGVLVHRIIEEFKEENYLKKGENQTVFEDMNEISGFAKKEIESLVSNNIMNGYPDNKFKPKSKLTRSEAVYLIEKLLDMTDIYEIETKFTDVRENSYFFQSLVKLEKAGVIKGREDSKFHPYESITRAEFVSILNEVFYLTAEK